MIVGVYKITNPNGDIYIGSSIDVYRRWKNHYSNQKRNEHTKLGISFKKYGFYNHVFEIIEECLLSTLRIRERYWQLYYRDKSNINLVSRLEIHAHCKSGVNPQVYLHLNTGIFYFTIQEISKDHNMTIQQFKRKYYSGDIEVTFRM